MITVPKKHSGTPLEGPISPSQTKQGTGWGQAGEPSRGARAVADQWTGFGFLSVFFRLGAFGAPRSPKHLKHGAFTAVARTADVAWRKSGPSARCLKNA